MSDFPNVFLARHGETAWSLSGQHTGLTDLPLTARGEANARTLAAPLAGVKFALVLTSPLIRGRARASSRASAALRSTTAISWSGTTATTKASARRTSCRRTPGWKLFNDGCPGGESPVRVAARADRVIARARAAGGNVLLFSSGHILRMIGARWLGLPPSGGAYFLLGTASVSVLSYEHDMSEPVHRSWNDMHHLTAANK
jgi:probable phosphoglycerate mutase